MRSLAENQDVAGLHKMPTGVEGFDAITGGGLPRNRTSLILGGPGGGKTVFALQTLVNGARHFGEPGIFVKAEADARGARRIVFDAVDALLSLLDDPLAERREIYRLGDWLSEGGLPPV